MHNEIFFTDKDIHDFKIALISDIHYYPEFKQKTFDRLIRQIKKKRADYIVIAGDTLDSSDITDLEKLERFFRELASICPTFIVKGNHDEKKGTAHNWTQNKNIKFTQLIKEIENMYYLEDKALTVNNITFYGFEMTYDYYEVEEERYESFCKEMENIHPHLSDSTYNVTIFHSPINIYDFIRLNSQHNLSKSDLILSGHMHNGCLPFLLSHLINKLFKTSRGILSPTREFFPKYAQGRVYERDGYVYEGVTKVSHSTKSLHVLDMFFRKNVEFLTIKKRDK